MKVLFTPITTSSIAHIIRSMAVADEMQRRGHDVFFTSCTEKKPFIENRGYKVIATHTPVNMNDKEDQSINYLKDNHEKFVDWFSAEIEAARELRPDVVVAASGLFGPHPSHADGFPVVQIMDSQYFPESKGMMGISLAKDTLRNRIIRPILRPLFEKKFIELYLSEVLDIYKELGIDSSGIKDRKTLYAPSLVLIPADDVFEPLYKTRANTYHIGPLFWDGFETMDTDLTDTKIKDFKGDEKLVFLTFGASVFDREIYNKILDELINNEHKMIVCLGPNWKREDFPDDNKHFLIRRYVPGLRVSRYADLIINTGSQGAIMQGLTFGKPQVSFPTTIDQSFFANRLEELGLGINVNKIGLAKFAKRENYTLFPKEIPDRIIKAINIILGDASFEIKASAHAKVLKSYKNSPLRAVELIEAFIK
ncbi:hypothetical protein JW978_02315 [Candidatus Dojkabacteria bacterium]|nr:hypothetical protein [Candidatus Dojkabacteria bacterium]